MLFSGMALAQVSPRHLANAEFIQLQRRQPASRWYAGQQRIVRWRSVGARYYHHAVAIATSSVHRARVEAAGLVWRRMRPEL
jgi:hypothetical protein